MVDTDMVFAADALDRLIARADMLKRPLLGALCWSQNDGAAEPYPTMYDLTENGDGVLAFTRPTSWVQGAVRKCSATGAAFLLIHRTALERIRDTSLDPAAPWFRESAVGVPLSLMGEDMTFCLRAAAANIPVHVYTGVQVGHMKPVMLGKVN
jgi:GT2 family glycosyltransferase